MKPNELKVDMPAEHRFLKFILPEKAYAAVRAGTKVMLGWCE